MVTKIAQYSDTSATTLLDSAEFAYDHAGNLAERTQTIDSHTWTTSFSHDLHAPDGTSNLRSTYVLSELTYPDTTTVGYSYVDSGSWDRAAGRVSTVWVDRADDSVGAATLAAYWYNGSAELMEHRAYLSSGSFTERSLAHSLDDLDPGSYRTYPNLDAFDRVTHSWLRRINVTTTPTTSYATFYKVSMLTSAPAAGYDFNSNIVGLKDDRWDRYSADFSVDGLNRLTQRSSHAPRALLLPQCRSGGVRGFAVY